MAKNPSEDGFTLIELLVTIAIIAALAAIAIPTLLQQRQKAYVASMQNDLHSAVVAEQAYGTNHTGFTATVSDLVAEGYRSSDGVTPVHVRLSGNEFVACVKHAAASHWLVYDSTSQTMSPSPSDCA
jgi:prepilin-type N-terminal cleavage/methylation domain-containing protein